MIAESYFAFLPGKNAFKVWPELGSIPEIAKKLFNFTWVVKESLDQYDCN